MCISYAILDTISKPKMLIKTYHIDFKQELTMTDKDSTINKYTS